MLEGNVSSVVHDPWKATMTWAFYYFWLYVGLSVSNRPGRFFLFLGVTGDLSILPQKMV